MTWQGILVGAVVWMFVCTVVNLIDMDPGVREYITMGVWTPVCWIGVVIVGCSIRLYIECRKLIRKTMRERKERSE